MVDAFHFLPNIRTLIQNKQVDEAIEIINQNLELLSPYLRDIIPLIENHPNPETQICLSKMYLILQNHDRAVSHAIRASSNFLNDGSFYYKAIIFRMMERRPNPHLNELVHNLTIEAVKSRNVSDCLLGYLFDSKHSDRFPVLKSYLGDNGDPSILDYLVSAHRDDIYKMISDFDSRDPAHVFYLVDALMYFDDMRRLKNLILELHEEDLPTAYYVCFYIQDNYELNLVIKDKYLMKILSGDFKREIFSKFMTANNLTSFRFLDSITKVRSQGLSLVNGLMNMGTTNDTFYRSNTELFSHSKEWGRFADLAYLGMIHSYSEDPYEILKNHLPTEHVNKDGGGLLALGIIRRGTCNEEDNEFILYFLGEEGISGDLAMGGCIGLGLINISTLSPLIKEKMMKLGRMDSTLVAEGAMYGLGLLSCATWDEEVASYFLTIMEETDFERVRRCCGIGMSLNYLGCQNDEKIYFLLESDCAFKRYAGILSMGAAFCASDDISITSKVISTLLPYINDGDDDVKRGAVLGIGLVCCDNRDLLVGTLGPLSENHNFYVRAAVCLCLGLFLSGTSDQVACDMLEALMYDSNSLVRQSASIGIGFLIMQGNPFITKNYKRIIDKLNKSITERGEDSSVKYGALMGRGISEAGGRNMIFNIRNLSNRVSMEKVAGAILFMHYWYFYPLTSMLCLCEQPTGFFCYNEKLEEVKDFSMKYKGNYDNHLIKLPEIKKSRRFKPKVVEEKDQVIKAAEEVISGERCTLLQMKELGIEIPGILFIDTRKDMKD